MGVILITWAKWRYDAEDSQSVTKMLPKSSLIRSTFELITALLVVVSIAGQERNYHRGEGALYKLQALQYVHRVLGNGNVKANTAPWAAIVTASHY